MSSRLEKTHARLKSMGYIYAKVEYFNPWSKTTLDFFGFGDTLAVKADRPGVFATNSCGNDISTHINKYLSGYTRPATEKRPEKVFGPNECLLPWLQAGNRFELWGWRLRKHKGTRPTWQLRRVEFLVFDGKVIAREMPNIEDLNDPQTMAV